MSIILGVDPGPKQSAIVVWDSVEQKVWECYMIDNAILLGSPLDKIDSIVIEMIASYGMPVGREVFDTCFWIGRIYQSFSRIHVNLIYRKDIKMHFCNSMRAKDSNIRMALIDRFGTPGTKKKKGKMYGIKADLWSALALAVYWGDIQKGE